MGVLGIKHQGLGKKHIKQRRNTEKSLMEFLTENQPAYFNQILKDSKISDPHALKNSIQRLLDKNRIRLVPDHAGPTNRKYYALKNYYSGITPHELENFRKVPRKKLSLLNYRSKENSSALEFSKILQYIEKLYTKSNFKSKLTINDYKNIIVLSETILTKKHACKIYHITIEALSQKIKSNKELQTFQKNIREKIIKAEKINAQIIPQIRNNELMVATVKNSVAKKYGY